MEYLYLIRCNEFIKIGISYDVEARLSALQIGNPYPLAIVDKFEFADAGYVESFLHDKFADAWEQGEWFRMSDSQLEEVKEVCISFDGVRPVKPIPSAIVRRAFLDISILPTERVIADADLEILPTLRAERRGDRYPIAFAFYKRGKPIYVGYVSEAILESM